MLRSALLAFLLVLSPNLYAVDEELVSINMNNILAYHQEGDTMILLLDSSEYCSPGLFDAVSTKADLKGTLGCWVDNKEQTGFNITWSYDDIKFAPSEIFTFVKQRFI